MKQAEAAAASGGAPDAALTPGMLLREVLDLRRGVVDEASTTFASWRPHVMRTSYRPCAENLAHYLALRRRDLTALQRELACWGLSSLGRSEAHVLQNIDAVAAALAAMAGEPLPEGVSRPSCEAYGEGGAMLREQQRALFGSDTAGPRSRVMVTLPAQAARDPALCAALVAAGTDCVRINCGHDDAQVWRAMAENMRAAARAARRTCPILVDLGGAKLRISGIAGDATLRVKVGEFVAVLASGVSPWPVPAAYCAELQSQAGLSAGDAVWMDDGRIGCVVEEAGVHGVLLRVVQAKASGSAVKPGNGVICVAASPTPALTARDRVDLDFVVEHADMVGLSFVQTPEDVRELQRELAARGRAAMPIVLKIETRLAVQNLPRLIVAAAGRQPAAVMIARGDLALALGFERLAEVQEEMLWLCEAAQVPAIWATQVLERLIRKGRPTRAEATDAAMAQRAECVMLNKGAHLVEGVRFLAGVLRRMDRHQEKKSARLGVLHAWDGGQTMEA